MVNYADKVRSEVIEEMENLSKHRFENYLIDKNRKAEQLWLQQTLNQLKNG